MPLYSRTPLASLSSALAVPAICLLLSAEAMAFTITNYSAAANNRFGSDFLTNPTNNTNASYVGAAYDLTGVGWAPVPDRSEKNACVMPRRFTQLIGKGEVLVPAGLTDQILKEGHEIRCLMSSKPFKVGGDKKASIGFSIISSRPDADDNEAHLRQNAAEVKRRRDMRRDH